MDTWLWTHEGTLSMESTSVEFEGFSALSVAVIWGIFWSWPADTTGHFGVHDIYPWSVATPIFVLQLVHQISIHYASVTSGAWQRTRRQICAHPPEIHQLFGYPLQSHRPHQTLAWSLRSLSRKWRGRRLHHSDVRPSHRGTKPQMSTESFPSLRFDPFSFFVDGTGSIGFQSFRLAAVTFHLGSSPHSGHHRTALRYQGRWLIYDDNTLPDAALDLSDEILCNITTLWLVKPTPIAVRTMDQARSSASTAEPTPMASTATTASSGSTAPPDEPHSKRSKKIEDTG